MFLYNVMPYKILGFKVRSRGGVGAWIRGGRSSVLAGIRMPSVKVARERFLYVVRLAEKLSDISYFQ